MIWIASLKLQITSLCSIKKKSTNACPNPILFKAKTLSSNNLSMEKNIENIASQQNPRPLKSIILPHHSLKSFLNSLYHRYNIKSFVQNDPIRFVHQFSQPKDQEIVAFIASTLAFGYRKQAIAFIHQVLNPLSPNPYQTILNFNIQNVQSLQKLIYRFVQGPDILTFLYQTHRILQQYGSLQNLFMEKFQKTLSIKQAMIHFVDRFRQIPLENTPHTRFKTFKFLLPNPKDRSPCKRLNLFLRWMIRKDQVDLGLWQNIPKKMLYIPVDTHVQKLAKQLKLTQKKYPNWNMCEEITSKLRQFDPNDPVKYDLALLGYSISIKTQKY